MAARISALPLVCRRPGTNPCATGHHLSASDGSAAMRLHPATRVKQHVGWTHDPSMKRSTARNGAGSNQLVRAGCCNNNCWRERTDCGRPIHPCEVRHLGSPPSRIFVVSQGYGRDLSKWLHSQNRWNWESGCPQYLQLKGYVHSDYVLGCLP